MAAPESVIEIGSTGVRLLVAEINKKGQITVLDRSEMPLPLGRDVFTSGEISQETQNLCVNILKRYREQLKSWDITPLQTSVFATNAFREARNSDPVMDRILVQTGFRVKIVDSIEENRLMYLAVTESFKNSTYSLKKSNSVILVVGGGSSEIMTISKGKMAGVHSLRLGTVRIDRQISVSTASYEDIRRYIAESINSTKGTIESELYLSKIKQFVAVGPDVTLAAVICGKPVSTFLWSINREDFDKFVNEIQDYSIDECVARFKISYNEAETLQLSLLIYNTFIKLTKVQTILVPETNIRNGFMISKNSTHDGNLQGPLQKEFNMQVIASAKNLLRRYHGDEKHAECVRQVASKIFEKMGEELALDDHAKILLETAAILHDIGVFIRHDQHNFHSSYIIKNSEIFGLSKTDKIIIAEIAKYHRGKVQPQDEEIFQMLARTERMTILKLTAILRIADALDRGHVQKFENCSIEIQQNTMNIQTKNVKNTTLEKMALSEKAGLFESVFGYKVILG